VAVNAGHLRTGGAVFRRLSSELGECVRHFTVGSIRKRVSKGIHGAVII